MEVAGNQPTRRRWRQELALLAELSGVERTVTTTVVPLTRMSRVLEVDLQNQRVVVEQRDD